MKNYVTFPLILLTLLSTFASAQRFATFNSEIDENNPVHRTCNMRTESIVIPAITTDRLKSMHVIAARSQTTIIQLYNCQFSIEGSIESPSAHLHIEEGTPTGNLNYWSIGEKNSALGIELIINNIKIPPSGATLSPQPIGKNGLIFNAEARLLRISQEEVIPEEFNLGINFRIEFK
ncbi:hypothetical protein MMG00_03965 [Ignatzschineria rhizosphaerae]|uniref:Fimbrial-type adhesion domain-containing protein n=1 Tax=Ignatzschineria rhizosphaerae TaxID=2923279 RepID=A0ABY3X2B8_9GAMM|nr:hypothetical protein [Ignatzschineria rhizosphaerae]UNM97016.1 hypothetical protein MMG00_03965 [Ignatzschineria rhizosphaerae]